MPELDRGSSWHPHEFYEGNGGFRLIGWGSNERGSNPHLPPRGGHEMVLKRGQGLKSPRNRVDALVDVAHRTVPSDYHDSGLTSSRYFAQIQLENSYFTSPPEK